MEVDGSGNKETRDNEILGANHKQRKLLLMGGDAGMLQGRGHVKNST